MMRPPIFSSRWVQRITCTDTKQEKTRLDHMVHSCGLLGTMGMISGKGTQKRAIKIPFDKCRAAQRRMCRPEKRARLLIQAGVLRRFHKEQSVAARLSPLRGLQRTQKMKGVLFTTAL